MVSRVVPGMEPTIREPKAKLAGKKGDHRPSRHFKPKFKPKGFSGQKRKPVSR